MGLSEEPCHCKLEKYALIVFAIVAPPFAVMSGPAPTNTLQSGASNFGLAKTVPPDRLATAAIAASSAAGIWADWPATGGAQAWLPGLRTGVMRSILFTLGYLTLIVVTAPVIC